MKKLLVLFFMLALLTSCTQSEPEPAPTAVPTPDPNSFAAVLAKFFDGAEHKKTAVLRDLDGDGTDEVVAAKYTAPEDEWDKSIIYVVFYDFGGMVRKWDGGRLWDVERGANLFIGDSGAIYEMSGTTGAGDPRTVVILSNGEFTITQLDWTRKFVSDDLQELDDEYYANDDYENPVTKEKWDSIWNDSDEKTNIFGLPDDTERILAMTENPPPLPHYYASALKEFYGDEGGFATLRDLDGDGMDEVVAVKNEISDIYLEQTVRKFIVFGMINGRYITTDKLELSPFNDYILLTTEGKIVGAVYTGGAKYNIYTYSGGELIEDLLFEKSTFDPYDTDKNIYTFNNEQIKYDKFIEYEEIYRINNAECFQINYSYDNKLPLLPDDTEQILAMTEN